jgi:hypothetical protein
VAASILLLLVAAQGCRLEKVEIPELIGPAELSLSLRLTANPDVLVADNVSTSSIQATLRNASGQPVAGRAIFFAIIAQGGEFAAIGELSATSAVTEGNGIAQVIYSAPARPDATANQNVLIAARPVGDDAAGQVYRTVVIELRSAEQRIFPPNPNNKTPICRFITQPPIFGPIAVGEQILFQSTSFDPDGRIVRYAWDFGDGTRSDRPDTEKTYFRAGAYTVNHQVWDNNGAPPDPTKAADNCVPQPITVK